MAKSSKQINLKFSTQELGLFGDSTQPRPFGGVDYLNDLSALVKDA